jgi:hypothetical protein
MLQANPTSLSLKRLKPISRALLIAETLDVLTTFAGFYLAPQMWEANPMLAALGGWAQLLLAKVAAVLLVVFVLERVRSWPRLAWIIPLVAALPVAWNALALLVELAL